MLELTRRINDSGLSRFKVGLSAGVNPERIKAFETGQVPHYTEVSRLGKYFDVNGYELFEEVKGNESLPKAD